MAEQERDFYARSEEEQAAFLEQTWCNNCQQPDLGMTDPSEFEQDGVVVIQGKCKKCGETITTELSDDSDDDF